MKLGYLCSQCGGKFANKSSLVRHSRTAKYCTNLSNQIHECIYCPYKTKLRHNLVLHLEVCKQKDKIEPYIVHITELEKIVEDHQAELEELREFKRDSTIRLREKDEKILHLELQMADSRGQIKVYKERPGVTNNQYVNKLLQVKCDTIRPFTIETVREDVSDGKYTFDRFIQGEKGLIGFISDIISQDEQRSYVCTDSSRQKFHRLLESREWREDNGATFLNKVLDELKEPTTQYYKRITEMMCDTNGDRELAEILMKKTKPMAMGITCPKSKDRDATFTKIRNEVRKLAAV